MRKLIIFLLFISTATLPGCIVPAKHSAAPAQMVTTHQQIGPFTALNVDGSMDIELVSQSAGMNRLAFESSQDLAGTVIATESQGTLTLRNTEKVRLSNAPRVRIKVPTGELTAITYNGAGTLRGQNIRGRNLSMVVTGSPSISLSGSNIDLRTLTMTGSGTVFVSGINTGSLKIQGKQESRIILSGTATTIDVVLSKDSSLDAKDLQTTNGVVNTADNARAEVNVTKLLNAFSTGYSNIYYHQQQPALLNRYLRQNGSVLFFAPR